MKLLVGLGNPGPQYAGTRHNTGAMVLDLLAANLGVSICEHRFDSLAAMTNDHGEKLLLLKPQTFMNLSGFAVVAAAAFYKIDWQDVLIVYDDLDLPLGKLRLRLGGHAGGHKGMGSVIAQSGRIDIARLRVGIGRGAYDTVDYVLGNFSAEEFTVLNPALKKAADACLCFAHDGLDRAMNQYNQQETMTENAEEKTTE